MTTHPVPLAQTFVPQSAYVSFRAPVNAQSAGQLLTTMTHIVAQQITDVHLLLATKGGVVDDGLHLYEMLRALPIEITTYNVGYVESIGNVIFLAGSRRYAAPTANFMFHGVGLDVQHAHFDRRHLQATLSGLKNDEGRIAEVYAKRTGLSKAQIRGLSNEPKFIGADDAKKLGIVHDIMDVKVPALVAFHQIVF